MSFHGADLEMIKRKYKIEKNLMDFSSNINPYFPENVEKISLESVKYLNDYPDIEYESIRNKISKHINYIYGCNLSKKNICVGNGATELIFLITRLEKKSRIGVVNPTFSEYERAVKISGNIYVDIKMNEGNSGFELDICEKIDDLDYLFICNPNNPDGKLRDITNIVKICEEKGTKLIVDETFIEFCEEDKKYTALNYDYKDIFVIRAVTKFYGLPGVRFGYVLSKNERYIQRMWDIKEPWSVNTFAEKIVCGILDDYNFAKNTKEFYFKERNYLLNNLHNINGIKVFDTDSAFLLLRLDDTLKNINSKKLKKIMILKYGIVIRDASSFDGLNDRYVRIAIKKRKDNKALICAISEIINGTMKEDT